MANAKHLAKLKQGAAIWNDWRIKNPGILPDLSQEYFGQANLRKANLRGADLTEASLGQANLSGAKLRKANLSVTYLREAGLTGAKLLADTFVYYLPHPSDDLWEAVEFANWKR